MSAWLIRAGRGAKYANDWFDNGYITVYWTFTDFEIAHAREDIGRRAATQYANSSTQAQAMIASQVYRFGSVMQVGDTVVTYDPSSRMHHLGTVAGECEFKPSNNDEEHDFRYARKVTWNKLAPRDLLSDSAKNSLGTIATLSQVNDDVMNELMNAADGRHASETASAASDGTDATANATDATDDAEILRTTVDESIEKIKDRITLLSWDEMELLAAGLLRAMGYRTSMTPKGGDQGRDVIASPDGLSLSSPRIIIEVKHRKEKMRAPALRSFIGRLHDANKGLYINQHRRLHQGSGVRSRTSSCPPP